MANNFPLNAKVTDATIAERARKCIAEQLVFSVDDIKDESRIVDDLDADSIDLIEIIMAIEDEFELEIPDEDAEPIKTVAQVIEYLGSKVTA